MKKSIIKNQEMNDDLMRKIESTLIGLNDDLAKNIHAIDTKAYEAYTNKGNIKLQKELYEISDSLVAIHHSILQLRADLEQRRQPELSWEDVFSTKNDIFNTDNK